MSAHDNLGAQFNMRDIPEPFGTKPIPADSVRVNHYTSRDSVDSIRRGGLTMEHARESYARGGTEYPSIFANAGEPKEDLLRSRPVVEAHIPVSQLDIGRPWRGEDPSSAARDLEARHSTVTTNEDLSPKNIVAIHEPWHQSFRYMQNEPSLESGIVHGNYDSGHDDDPDFSKALDATKVALAGKVMLGGKLEGSHW